MTHLSECNPVKLSCIYKCGQIFSKDSMIEHIPTCLNRKVLCRKRCCNFLKRRDILQSKKHVCYFENIIKAQDEKFELFKNSFAITVKSYGEVFNELVHKEQTVLELKEKMLDQLRIQQKYAGCWIIITKEGYELKDTSNLEDYNIQAGSTLWIRRL